MGGASSGGSWVSTVTRRRVVVEADGLRRPLPGEVAGALVGVAVQALCRRARLRRDRSRRDPTTRRWRRRCRSGRRSARCVATPRQVQARRRRWRWRDGKRNSPARNDFAVSRGPARCTPVKKISGACTSSRNVFAAGGAPVCQVIRLPSSSTSSAVRAGSNDTPNACAHCSWSYWRPNTAVSVNA